MVPVPCRIARYRRELADTFTVELDPAGGGFAFAPGQFNMLYVFGVGEVPISISGDPREPGQLIHTVRQVGPVTEAMGRLRRGAALGVRGPFGTGWPVTEAEGSDVVIVAGGLGLAPLRPAIYHVLANRERYGNVCLFYGARTPADILFLRQLHQWRGRFDLTVDVTVDRAGSDWSGRVGVVTRLLENGGYDPPHSVALVCGPEVMMRFAVKTLLEQGLAEDDIYLSMERNMKCAVGFCGHCQFGPGFVCKDGPVYRYEAIQRLLAIREL
ncbi:MAG: FAD/NAD(P)-binding protein [Candidatus Competibacterales bacterium]|nr:FAD/NAD(P)-binding protein [Candidatus Competibacterales bacterium]